jgi:hypothetical protein
MIAQGPVAEGDNLTITANLVDDRGLPIADADITFIVNLTRIGDTTTDAAGTASIVYAAPLPGRVEIQASYGGDGYNYSICSSSATLVEVLSPTNQVVLR